MTATTLFILINATCIIFVIFLIIRKVKRPLCRTIYKRRVLEIATEKGEQIYSIYACENCGHEQHGLPPCEMCDYEKMKPLK
jgi:hypothetical protein